MRASGAADGRPESWICGGTDAYVGGGMDPGGASSATVLGGGGGTDFDAGEVDDVAALCGRTDSGDDQSLSSSSESAGVSGMGATGIAATGGASESDGGTESRA